MEDRAEGGERDLAVRIDPKSSPRHHQPYTSRPRVYPHKLECALSCWECLRNLRHNRMRYVAAFRAHRESQVRYLCIQARGCRIHVRIR